MTRQTYFPKFTSLALAILAILAIVSHSGTAMAGWKTLGGTHSESEIKGACDRAGGVFYSTSVGYSCVAVGGSIDCTKEGQCTGECASCVANVVKGNDGTPIGVLSGTKLKEVGTAPSKTTEEPAKTAEPVKTNEPAKTAGPTKTAEPAKTEPLKSVGELKKGERANNPHTAK